MTLTLQEDGGIVTGTGVLSGPGDTFTVTVTGTFDDPGFALNLETPGVRSATFAGTVNGGVMHGTLNGSGFANEAVTLRREGSDDDDDDDDDRPPSPRRSMG